MHADKPKMILYKCTYLFCQLMAVVFFCYLWFQVTTVVRLRVGYLSKHPVRQIFRYLPLSKCYSLIQRITQALNQPFCFAFSCIQHPNPLMDTFPLLPSPAKLLVGTLLVMQVSAASLGMLAEMGRATQGHF